MSGEKLPPTPPSAHVKPVALRRFGGILPRQAKIGRGFSLGEINALNLNEREARLLGIYVDTRRKTVHEENIEILKEYLQHLKKSLEEGSLPPKPALPSLVIAKPDFSRVFKGKTSSGREGRGLHSIKYRYTHHRKWKKKQKERLLKKRHEAARTKGGD